MLKKNAIAFLIMLVNSFIFSQDFSVDYSMDIFLIDSYVTPEKPHRLRISFFTSDSLKSKIILDDQYEISVSEKPTTDHSLNQDITGYQFDSTRVNFFIILIDVKGNEFKSEIYDLALPDDNELLKGKGSSLLTLCCFGGVIFGLPSPTFVAANDKNYFGLSKEIPVLSFYAKGYNYPAAYVSLEYSHIFKFEKKNYIRSGFKYIHQLPFIEFISPGVNGFTDFKGFNGISPEITVGWMRIYNVFTLFTRYRYNFKPGESDSDFHEISIGLYSNFFSLNL